MQHFYDSISWNTDSAFIMAVSLGILMQHLLWQNLLAYLCSIYYDSNSLFTNAAFIMTVSLCLLMQHLL